MEQVLNNSVAPTAFGFALLCASQVSSFSLTVAGQVATEGFLGVELPSLVHQVFTRLAAVIIALFLLLSLGSEGTYQVLIFSQIILSLQLPLVIVPLLKVTLSPGLMGHMKHSWIIESFSWACTGLLYLVNVWIAFDMFSAETEDYIGSTSWSLVRGLDCSIVNWGEANRSFCLSILVGVTTLFSLLLMWIISVPLKVDCINIVSRDAVTGLRALENLVKSETLETEATFPLPDGSDNYVVDEAVAVKDTEHITEKGASMELDTSVDSLNRVVELPALDSSEDDLNGNIDSPAQDQTPTEDQTPKQDETIEKEIHVQTSVADISATVLGNKDILTELSAEVQQEPINESSPSTGFNSCMDSLSSMDASKEGIVAQESQPVESAAAVIDNHEKALSGKRVEPFKETVDDIDIELLDNNDFDIDGWEALDQDDNLQDSLSVVGGSTNSLTFEEPGSGRSFTARSEASEGSCGGSGSGSLSRLSGLGRSARKQFAALLDEFWGKLYDLHGQPVSQQGKQAGCTKMSQVDTLQQQSLPPYKEPASPNTTWCTAKFAQKPWQTNFKRDMMGHTSMYLQPSYAGLISDSYNGNDAILSNRPLDVNEKKYSSLTLPSFQDNFDSQPATFHGYKNSSYGGRKVSFSTEIDDTSFCLERQAQSLDEQTSSIFRQRTLVQPEMGPSMPMNAVQSYLPSSYTKRSMNRPFDHISVVNKSSPSSQDNRDPYARSQWTSYTENDSASWDPLVYRATGELDICHYNQLALQKNSESLGPSYMQQRTGGSGYLVASSSHMNTSRTEIGRHPLSFDDISPSQTRKDAFSIQAAGQQQSLWSTQPFEQLFGSGHGSIGSSRSSTPNVVGKSLSHEDVYPSLRNSDFSLGHSNDSELLNTLRLYIRKLLKLEGSEWLFRFESGSDEDLIAMVATREKVLLDAEIMELRKLSPSTESLWASSSQKPISTTDTVYSTLGSSGVPHCGEGCVWNAELLVSFGVWCVHRVLELALMESRPELWGKYTYVLNRLQGVLDPAFSKPRIVQTSCFCVISEISEGHSKNQKEGGAGGPLIRSLSGGFSGNVYQGYAQTFPWGRNSSTVKGKGASSTIFLEIIKDVETAIGTRKGRTGTAAGDVAFPKGKENLASVLKRYKRRLGNKTTGMPSNSNSRNRRAPMSSPSIFG
ncbi:hypothetical protein KP509_05G026600 [Ceratopteris richardii]|nr:hypothetical protein KP509_05G026600 [Ceratopteris richardii]